MVTAAPAVCAPKRRHRPFTASDDAALRELWLAGEPATRIAAVLGRSVAVVRGRVRLHGWRQTSGWRRYQAQAEIKRWREETAGRIRAAAEQEVAARCSIIADRSLSQGEQMRALRRSGLTQKEIAAYFAVSGTRVRRILNGPSP